MAQHDGSGTAQQGAMIRTSLFAPQQAPGVQDGDLDAGTDLLAAVGITQRMYKHATTRPLGNYFAGVVGNVQLFRSSQSDLGPLTGIFASNSKPDFRPLDRHTMAAAFSLQPGIAMLSTERKGQAVASEDLLGTPVVPSALPQPGAAIKPPVGDMKKEKRKREKKEKKEKKEDKKQKLTPTAT